MNSALRPYVTAASIALVGASIIAVTPVAPPPANAQVWSVRLTSTDVSGSGDVFDHLANTPLGNGVALVYGGSFIPNPTQEYLDNVVDLYLKPMGFTGHAQVESLPDMASPLSGPESLGYGDSLQQGVPVMVNDIERAVTSSHADAANPVVVFGYSQSAQIASLIMPQLKADGVPTDAVHFVFIGNVLDPTGGIAHIFDVPGAIGTSLAPGLGPSSTLGSGGATSISDSALSDVTFHGGPLAGIDYPEQPATPSDLYPTTIFSLEYDGVPDSPHYAGSLLADLNADLGTFFEHFSYLTIPESEIQSAITLPGSESLGAADLTDYLVISNDNLPLTELLLLIPGIGKPLHDLLTPYLTTLVNAQGYGSLTDGFNGGPQNVPDDYFGTTPTNISPAELSAALSQAWQQGVQAAMNDIAHPESYTEQIQPLEPFIQSIHDTFGFGPADPSFSQFIDALLKLFNFPVSDVSLSSSPSLTDIATDISETLHYDANSMAPLTNAINSLDISLPAYDAALGDPDLATAANDALGTFDVLFGIESPLVAILGTAVNLDTLFS
jgi:hypothetical protein